MDSDSLVATFEPHNTGTSDVLYSNPPPFGLISRDEWHICCGKFHTRHGCLAKLTDRRLRPQPDAGKSVRASRPGHTEVGASRSAGIF